MFVHLCIHRRASARTQVHITIWDARAHALTMPSSPKSFLPQDRTRPSLLKIYVLSSPAQTYISVTHGMVRSTAVSLVLQSFAYDLAKTANVFAHMAACTFVMGKYDGCDEYLVTQYAYMHTHTIKSLTYVANSGCVKKAFGAHLCMYALRLLHAPSKRGL